MSAYYDLKRRFVERPKYDPDELVASEISGKRLDWAKVLASRFAVIVAPANYGKTTEMCQRAAQMRTGGEAAFLVALRKVSERHSVEKALDSEDLSAFRAWSASPTWPLTVFVDSLDEASAGKQVDIDYLVRVVAEAVQWPNAHVRWVISTRPAVLTSDVIATLSAVLVSPFLAASVSVSARSKTFSAGATTTQPIASDAATEAERHTQWWAGRGRTLLPAGKLNSRGFWPSCETRHSHSRPRTAPDTSGSLASTRRHP